MPAKEIINSESVRVFEGTAQELQPSAKLPSDMHGFAVLVPAGAVHEWKLDLLWRITFLYALHPRSLKSRANVLRIVEAVMQSNRRPDPVFEKVKGTVDKADKRGRNESRKKAKSAR